MFTYFKNDSIRKLVIAFGSLFNNIHIMQKSPTGVDKDELVPITYSPKEKFVKRLVLPSSIPDATRVELNMPQIGFEITNITYDPARHLNKTHKKILGSTGASNIQSYMEVPYNFTFGLYAYTRNIDENLQIMEQILPYFSPEFVITINVNNIKQIVFQSGNLFIGISATYPDFLPNTRPLKVACESGINGRLLVLVFVVVVIIRPRAHTKEYALGVRSVRFGYVK